MKPPRSDLHPSIQECLRWQVTNQSVRKWVVVVVTRNCAITYNDWIFSSLGIRSGIIGETFSIFMVDREMSYQYIQSQCNSWSVLAKTF